MRPEVGLFLKTLVANGVVDPLGAIRALSAAPSIRVHPRDMLFLSGSRCRLRREMRTGSRDAEPVEKPDGTRRNSVAPIRRPPSTATQSRLNAPRVAGCGGATHFRRTARSGRSHGASPNAPPHSAHAGNAA